MRKLRYDDVVCVLACVVTLGMSALSVIQSGSLDYEFNTGLFCGLFCLVPAVLRHLGVLSLPAPFVVMIEVAIFLHAYGVLLLQYDMLQYYDTITHFISSTVVAMCVFYTLTCYTAFSGGAAKFSRNSLPIAIALIMLGFSAYWEVFEYLVDLLFGTNMQYSPFDTLRDMLCNTCGSLMVSLLVGIYIRRRSPEEIASKFELNDRLKAFIRNPFGDSGEKQ